MKNDSERRPFVSLPIYRYLFVLPIKVLRLEDASQIFVVTVLQVRNISNLRSEDHV